MYRRLMGVVLALALVAAACGDDDDADTTQAPATTQATTTTAASGGEDVTLRWRTRPDNDQEANVYPMISNGKAHNEMDISPLQQARQAELKKKGELV